MDTMKSWQYLILSASLAMLMIFTPTKARAHCDGLDGPVVKAAQQALAAGNVNLILIWVQKKDEGEIRSLFNKTLEVRKLSPQAKELADMYLFESLVRIHRAGEGEPYTGLKPAGRDLGPAIPAADQALDSGTVEPLLKLLSGGMEREIQKKFKEAIVRKRHRPDDVEAGRAYVESYVSFVTYVESIYQTLTKTYVSHTQEPAEETLHR
jgi:hypothetical protein